MTLTLIQFQRVGDEAPIWINPEQVTYVASNPINHKQTFIGLTFVADGGDCVQVTAPDSEVVRKLQRQSI